MTSTAPPNATAGVIVGQKPRPLGGSGKKPSFPALPGPVPLPRFAVADDLRAAIGLWAAWLSGERRASAHTV
ncbi:MAG: hypothetical protein JO081_00705, partial [Alphaproteobacteria bacterium]|nr:hypothetical protein [Alphaproteobacteria bacterium]